MKRIYGLLGRNISYSFSRDYFTRKFQRENIAHAEYRNFDLPALNHIDQVLRVPELAGLNVTIPYKQQIIPFLDEIDEEAKAIGAVNTITIRNGRTKGYNTDVYGFEQSFTPLWKPYQQKALILGTGGASLAVTHVLNKLGIKWTKVSRTPKPGELSYAQITKELLHSYLIIINCTPKGTYPAAEEKPDIPYPFLTSRHYLYDLIYNPPVTAFLKSGQTAGAQICNGQAMLEGQAEKAWKLWNQF